MVQDKGAENTQCRTVVSLINGVEKAGQPYAEEWNSTTIHTISKINANWLKDIILVAIKLRGEHTVLTIFCCKGNKCKNK